MPYKLYIDKPEDFICEVSVKNASLKGSVARLIVESSNGLNLIFNGKIENGTCTIPIKRLKGFIDENSHGNIFLEVIVEDTYFQPWKSDFVCEEHTSIKVKVNEEKIIKKPIVEVKTISELKNNLNETKGINVYIPLHEISQICKKFGITKSNVINKKRREFFAFN